MAKLDKLAPRGATSVIVSTPDPKARTFEGAPGFSRDVKSELFLLGVTNMVSEKTFYEDAATRDDRYVQLVRAATREDADWASRFLRWLRSDANMRTASLVGAVEYAIARATIPTGPTGRSVVDAVCQRPDEPAEILAYFASAHGRRIPKAIKRGVADAATRLYTEQSYLKYGVGSRNWRFADVIELTHPTPRAGWQSDLFKYAIDSRHRETEPPESLGMLRNRNHLALLSNEEKRNLSSDELRKAGVTWEASSSWGEMDAKAWEKQIPNMGYMALLRNLRNFDMKGVSDEVAATVAARLQDPDEVARSRQFPLRFFSALREVASFRWHAALEKAVNLSLSTVPALKGKTLILIDVSGSMSDTLSSGSKVSRRDAAALFGMALALRAEHAAVYAFNSNVYPVAVSKGAALLNAVNAVPKPSGGTAIYSALRATAKLDTFDRVIVLTDEQTTPDWRFIDRGWGWGRGSVGSGDVNSIVPLSTAVFVFNLAGYGPGFMATGTSNRHALGGLSSASFELIAMIENAKNGEWPF